jgi:hypothetical protein
MVMHFASVGSMMRHWRLAVRVVFRVVLRAIGDAERG